MISGKVDGIDIQVEIIEAKNKESFEKKLMKVLLKVENQYWKHLTY